MTDKRDTPPAETGRDPNTPCRFASCNHPRRMHFAGGCSKNFCQCAGFWEPGPAAPVSPPYGYKLPETGTGNYTAPNPEVFGDESENPDKCETCGGYHVGGCHRSKRGAGTVGATPEPTELRESLRPAAKEYLREWSDNYRRHGELALLHWDGGNIEYHLANFAARAAQSLPSPAPQKERFEAYERTHGRGDMLQPHPEGYNNEGTQSRWRLWQACDGARTAGATPEPESKADQQWLHLVAKLNTIHAQLQHKPSHLKCGHRQEIGSILNAYREGDLSFDEAKLAAQSLPSPLGAKAEPPIDWAQRIVNALRRLPDQRQITRMIEEYDNREARNDVG